MRTEESYICLNGLRFRARHGVLPQERLTGGDFVVDIRLRCNVARAVVSDDVADTVSYADIYEIVSKAMQTPSCLLEHLAGRMAESIFGAQPLVEEVWLRVVKKNPPMGADSEGASVEMRFLR